MKLLALLVTCLSLLGINAVTGDEVEWETQIEEAQKKALKESKPYLVYFTGSDWCSPCKSLTQDFFESSDFKRKASGLILVKLYVPRRIDIISEKEMIYNKQKLKELNPSKKFPTIIAYNEKGQEIDRISGYSSTSNPDSYFNFLDKILNIKSK